MEKKVLKLTEEELRYIIRESVERIIKENQEDEGWFDNIKSAFKGARQGYNTQKHLDSNVETDYSRNTRMSPQEAPSNDAAETVRNLYQMASEYYIKANKLRNKAAKIAEKYGVNVTDGKGEGKGKLANKIVNYDLTGEYQGKMPKINSTARRTKATTNGTPVPGSGWNQKAQK